MLETASGWETVMRKRFTFTVLAATSLLAIPSFVLVTASPAEAASCAGTAPSDFNAFLVKASGTRLTATGAQT